MTVYPELTTAKGLVLSEGCNARHAVTLYSGWAASAKRVRPTIHVGRFRMNLLENGNSAAIGLLRHLLASARPSKSMASSSSCCECTPALR